VELDSQTTRFHHGIPICAASGLIGGRDTIDDKTIRTWAIIVASSVA